MWQLPRTFVRCGSIFRLEGPLTGTVRSAISSPSHAPLVQKSRAAPDARGQPAGGLGTMNTACPLATSRSSASCTKASMLVIMPPARSTRPRPRSGPNRTPRVRRSGVAQTHSAHAEIAASRGKTTPALPSVDLPPRDIEASTWFPGGRPTVVVPAALRTTVLQESYATPGSRFRRDRNRRLNSLFPGAPSWIDRELLVEIAAC